MIIYHGRISFRQALYTTFIAPIIQSRRYAHSNYNTTLPSRIVAPKLTRVTENPVNLEIGSPEVLLLPLRTVTPTSQRQGRPSIYSLRNLVSIISRINSHTKDRSQHVYLVKIGTSHPPTSKEEKKANTESSHENQFLRGGDSMLPLCILSTEKQLRDRSVKEEKANRASERKGKKRKELEVKWTSDNHHIGFIVKRMQQFMRDGIIVDINFVVPPHSRGKQLVTPERAAEVADLLRKGAQEVITETTKIYKWFDTEKGRLGQVYNLQYMPHIIPKANKESRDGEASFRLIEVKCPLPLDKVNRTATELTNSLERGRAVKLAFIQRSFTGNDLLEIDDIKVRLKTAARSVKDVVEETKSVDQNELVFVGQPSSTNLPRIFEIESSLKITSLELRADWIVEAIQRKAEVLAYVPDKIVEEAGGQNSHFHKLLAYIERSSNWEVSAKNLEEIEESWKVMLDLEKGVVYHLSLTDSKSPLTSRPAVPDAQSQRIKKIPSFPSTSQIHESDVNVEPSNISKVYSAYESGIQNPNEYPHSRNHQGRFTEQNFNQRKPRFSQKSDQVTSNNSYAPKNSQSFAFPAATSNDRTLNFKFQIPSQSSQSAPPQSSQPQRKPPISLNNESAGLSSLMAALESKKSMRSKMK